MDLEEKQQRVLEVAKELFERFGFKKTTVDEISAGVGISKRTLYEMFDSKEIIFSELIQSESSAIQSLIQKETNSNKDPLVRLNTFNKQCAEYITSNPFLLKVLGDDAGLYRPFAANDINHLEEGIESFYYMILSEGAQRGTFRKMDEKSIANCIFVLFKNYTYMAGNNTNKSWTQFVTNSILEQKQIEKPAQSAQLELDF